MDTETGELIHGRRRRQGLRVQRLADRPVGVLTLVTRYVAHIAPLTEVGRAVRSA